MVRYCSYAHENNNVILVLLHFLRIILGAVGESRLVCSDRSFLVDLSQPTRFCQIHG